MGALSPTHWAIIIILVLLLFGSRKLPDLARGVGQSLRIFKAETSDLRGEGDKAEEKAPAVDKGGSTSEITTSGTSSATTAGSPGTTDGSTAGPSTTPSASSSEGRVTDSR